MPTPNFTDRYNMLSLFRKEIKEGTMLLLNTIPESRNCIGISKSGMAKILLENLCQRLFYLSEWILLAHYMVAEKDLDGNRITEKLDAFCATLEEPEVHTYFKEKYPLLFEGVHLEIRQWINQSVRLTERFIEDFPTITEALLEGKNPGNIQHIKFGLGDRHRGGETVSLLTFESGVKIIYKPGNRSLDQHFSVLCDWIDQHIHVGFRMPKVVSMSMHSWVEYIEKEDCTDEIQLHRFYERTGCLLGILYALEASDFHYENIIACGEFPVLIDLESFFQPVFPEEGAEGSQGIDNSVLRTGLLPRIFSTGEADATDISGLGDAAGAPGIVETLEFSFDENGSLQASRKKGPLNGGQNVPVINGKKRKLTRKSGEDIIQGFRKAYHFIRLNAEAVIEKLEPFKNDEIRVLFRNTVVYNHLLKESRHPEILKTYEALDNHLTWLDFALKDCPLVRYFSEAEKKDLKQHDIPFFYTKVNERHLWHDGKILWNDFFQKNGLEGVTAKINALCKDDLERQCWIIDASLVIGEKLKKPEKKVSLLPFEKQNHSRKATIDSSLEAPLFSREDFLKSSVQLSDSIIRNMKITENDAHWLVFKPLDLNATRYEIAPAMFDLYSGMPGEILYFAYLGQKTGNEYYGEIASKAFHHLYLQVEKSFETIRNLGLLTGWGGMIYMLTQLGKVWKDDWFYFLAEDWLERMEAKTWAEQEINSGLVKGSAGFILACLALYKQTSSDKTLTLAEEMAAKLLQKAIRTKHSIAWKSISEEPLTGLSHGASGFILCFARLYEHTRKESYKNVVHGLLRFENSLFSEKEGNWPDLRDFIKKQHAGKGIYYSTAWSHGAPGIGLVRRELIRLGFQEPDIENDLDRAVQTCLKKGFSGQHSLCFGDFGNLELLINAASLPKYQQLEDIYIKIGSRLLKYGFQKGFNLSNSNIQSPGLMNGLTGIAWQSLRLSDPINTPSLLSISE
jgi:type 2 lantibiotic biosynthesis protein LanM